MVCSDIGQICKKTVFQISQKRFRNLSQQCLGETSEMSLRCLFQMSNQRFCQTQFRFAKQLPFRHLENISARCLVVLARKLLDILQMSFRPLGSQCRDCTTHQYCSMIIYMTRVKLVSIICSLDTEVASVQKVCLIQPFVKYFPPKTF